MQERVQTRARREASASSGNLFDEPGPDAGADLVNVTHGVYGETLPVAGRTVDEIRGEFRDRFDIHPEAIAYVDGHQVDADTTVRAGQHLMFSRRAGEKGCVACLAA